MCKGSDVFSLTVLIDRGLDLQIRTDVNEHILTGSGADDTVTCSRFFPILLDVIFIQFSGL